MDKYGPERVRDTPITEVAPYTRKVVLWTLPIYVLEGVHKLLKLDSFYVHITFCIFCRPVSLELELVQLTMVLNLL